VRKAGISLGLALFFFLLAVRVGLAATPITNCTEINASGEYYLVNDIYANSSICFNISSGLNVTIDMNGYTLYRNYIEGVNTLFYGEGEPKANVTLINGTIEFDGGCYADFNHNLRMYVENVTLTSDGTCCPSFNFYDYIELKNVNISLVNWATYNLNFYSDALLDNIRANGQGYLYISLNWPGSLNITNSNLQSIGDIYTNEHFYSTTNILNSSLGEVTIYAPTSMKNVNLTGIFYIDPVDIKDLYLDNVYIGNTQVFYCDGCQGTYQEKYIVVKNSDINVTNVSLEFVYAYNSNVSIDAEGTYRIEQYGGTINARGEITNLNVYDVKGTVESYIAGNYDIHPFSDITLTQNSGLIYLHGNPTDEPSINLTLYGSVGYITMEGYCNLTYNNNITNGQYNGAKLRHNVLGISVETEGNIWTDFKRYIYEVSKERVRLVDDFEYASGQQVNYTIYNLKPNTTYNVYLNGTLAYTLTSSPDGTLGPFNVTFHSPVEITVEEQWQNPSWCDSLGTTILFNYKESIIQLTFDESNPNITSVNVNFCVDGVCNNQTGLWNWATIYDTSILNYYDGSSHTFDFEILYLNDSTAVCQYSGSFEANPYNETVYITGTWLNETHGGFTVDNRGLEYWWQVDIWNETHHVETVFGGSTANSSVTYAHANLTGQKGSYNVQIDTFLDSCNNVQVMFRNYQSEEYDFTAPAAPQNPEWCDNLQAYFIMHYNDSKIYITFDESNPNITSLSVNFSVDGVWNNQTGIWNWHPVYNTSILNYYDGNNHTFEFEVAFLNDSAPVCQYVGSFEINPSDETVYITDVWINETHGGFAVDNRGLEYWWQVTIWNATDYVETVFGSSSSSSVTYAHADLTGQSGEYETQIDRDLGPFGGIGLLIKNSRREPYDFRYFSVTFSYASVDFGNVVPYGTYTVEGLCVNISTTAQYSVYIYGNDFSPEWTIDNLLLNISYDGYSASKPFSPYETLFDTFPAQNVTHCHAYTLHVPLVLPGTYSTTVTIDYRL